MLSLLFNKDRKVFARKRQIDRHTHTQKQTKIYKLHRHTYTKTEDRSTRIDSQDGLSGRNRFKLMQEAEDRRHSKHEIENTNLDSILDN